MCGIVGIVSNGGTFHTGINALKALEYRGYDSFGFSTVDNGTIITKKQVGSVVDNSVYIANHPDSNVIIAHTRWATHGKVSEINSHPHISYDGNFSLVHNGVIENYREIKDELEKNGVCFKSDTDTEVIVHTLARNYNQTGNVETAITMTNKILKGSFTYIFISAFHLDTVFGTCNGSPIGFSYANGMAIVASDQIAISELSNKMVFLKDGDIIKATAKGVICYINTLEGLKEIQRESFDIPKSYRDNGKSNFSNYMMKEIHETPSAIDNANKTREEKFLKIATDISDKELSIVGAGSSFYVAQLGQYYFSQLAGKYSFVHPADEFLNLVKPDMNSHLIAISQSGETFDTLEVVKAFKNCNSTITSINNVQGSACQRLANFPLFQNSGIEISVLSTKSVSSQAMHLYRLAISLGFLNGTLSEFEYKKYLNDARKFSSIVKKLFTYEEKIKHIAVSHNKIADWFYIGKGITYPVAMEASLKFKEVTYIHAEGISSGSLKHGFLSLIDDSFYTMAFLPNKMKNIDAFENMLSNISEIQARNGKVIAFGVEDESSLEILSLYSYIKIPSINEYLEPILYLIAGQLFSNYSAESLGRNIDKPRSLAKSVTVR